MISKSNSCLLNKSIYNIGSQCYKVFGQKLSLYRDGSSENLRETGKI